MPQPSFYADSRRAEADPTVLAAALDEINQIVEAPGNSAADAYQYICDVLEDLGYK